MEVFVCVLIVFFGSLFVTYIIYTLISGKTLNIFFKGHLKNSSKIKCLLYETIEDYITNFYPLSFSHIKNIDIFVEEYPDLDIKRPVFIAEVLVSYTNDLGESFIRYIQINFNGRFKELCLSSFLSNLTKEDFNSSSGFDIYVLKHLSLCKIFKKYKLNTIYERFIDIAVSSKDSSKREESLETLISNFVYDIKNDIFEALNLSKDIEDIDISVSISELSETTDIFLDMINNESNESEIRSLSSHYIESIKEILKTLKEFKSLKEDDSLNELKEIELQNIIDKEVNNCSKLAKL